MKKEINIVLKAPIENLQNDLKAMLGEFAKTGKGIDKEMGATLASVEEALGKIATSKNTARAVKQLQNLALTVQELGPEFEGMAQKIIAEAGGIKDAVGDVGAQIDYFASDTRKFDAVLSGVQGLAGGFEVVQGTMALFGDENEDLQKTMMKLMATMSVVQGLQEVQNVLQKESTFMVGLQTAAQKAYNAVVGESVGAMKSFKVALAATGIGAAVVAVGALVVYWDDLKNAILGTTEIQRKVAEEMSKANASTLGQQAELKAYAAIVNDTNKSEAERAVALEAINKLGVETRDINLKSSESLKMLNDRITDNIALIQQQARAEALKNIISEQTEKLVRLEADQRKKFYQEVQAEAQKYNTTNKEIGNTLTYVQAQELATSIVTKKQAKERAQLQAELNEVTTLYQNQIDKLISSQTKQQTITDAVNKSEKANEEIIKAQSEARKKRIEELEKERKKLQEIREEHEWNQMQFNKPERQGTTLAKSQGRKSKADTEAYNLQMQAKLAEGSQIRLRRVVESESEKQQNAFRMTAQSYRDFQEQMETANESIQTSFKTMVMEVAVAFGVMTGELMSGENGFQKFMSSFIYSISDFLMALGKAVIAAGVAMTKFYEFLVSNPVLAVAAGVAAVAASVYVRNIADKGVAFADGGIVSGPTLGLVGEYANASTNPEVIAPLDKLKSIIGSPGDNTSGGYIAETRISGRDLAIILKREKEGSTRG
jgi:hypothetical protein